MTIQIAVIVLGDIGRSPRMMYHAESFANVKGSKVDIVGYKGEKEPIKLTSRDNVTFNYVTQAPRLSVSFSSAAFTRFLFILYAPFRVLYQLFCLFYVLFNIDKPDFMIVQNPPAIPTLLVCQVVCYCRGSKLIIDWHNFGFTILALNIGETGIVISIAKWFEQYFGKTAYAHLCVTRAMADVLINDWKIKGKVVVLHDRPLSHFQRLNIDEIHSLLYRLRKNEAFKPLKSTSSSKFATLLTTQDNENSTPVWTSNRPVLVVSSTSWTEDEDIQILLDAVQECELYAEKAKKSGIKFPRIVFIITGKGPMKAYYESKIESMKLNWMTIRTAWLSLEDYPKILGSADLEICLHTSSSKLDLPMKIVDMFGCGLPVCAINYSCLDELVTNNETGLLFDDALQLKMHLIDLFENFPQETKKIDQMRQNVIKQFKKDRWDDNWKRNVMPLLK